MSAALHAALIAGLARQHADIRRRVSVPVEVELREVRPERRAAIEAPERSATGILAPPGASIPGPPRAGLPPHHRQRRAEPLPEPERGTTAWLEAEGLRPGDAPPPTRDAFRPRLPAAEEHEAGRPGAAEAGQEERPSQGLLGEFRAAERARTPDRELAEMQRTLADFDAPWSSIEDGAGPGLLGHVATGYARSADEYGRTGRVSGSAFAREIIALVRVVREGDGRTGVALVSTSGYRAYDRLALARAREAAATEVGAALMQKHGCTVWAFVTRFEIVPPVPAVGCGFDALLHLDPSRCVYPLKKLPPVSRVELRGVE